MHSYCFVILCLFCNFQDTGALGKLPLIMICMIHTDKDLEYYCADHDVMCCSACVNIDHRRCDRVMFIKDITEEPTDRKIVAEAAVELREIRKNFDDIFKDTGEIVDNLEKQRYEIRERRDALRNQVMAMLDKLDTSSELEMEAIIQRAGQDMGQDSESSREILNQIDTSIQVLDAAVGHASANQLFVAGKRSVADRQKYMNLLNKSMGSVQNIQLEYKPDQTLERLSKSLQMYDGRCIASNNVRYNQKARDLQNPIFENNMLTQQTPNSYQAPRYQPSYQQVNYKTQTEFNRPLSEREARLQIYQTPRSDGLPPLAREQLVTGSVPDFNSSGYRLSEPSEYGSIRRPQPDNRFDRLSLQGFQAYNTNDPPAPRYAFSDIDRPLMNRTATMTMGSNRNRDDFDRISLPIIENTQTPRSEPTFLSYRNNQRQDFPPQSARTVGNNSLISPGLNQREPTRADLIATERASIVNASRASIPIESATLPKDTASFQRESASFQRDSNTFPREIGRSPLNAAPNRKKPIPLSGHEFSKTPKTDILAQASPIKRRSELKGDTAPYSERRAVLAGQFNVRLSSDQYTCSLKGAALLHDGRIALADYDNHNVKLFDAKLYRGKSLNLSSGPWDIVVTGPKELAVSLPFESKIQFIAVSDTMKATRVIKIDMDCYGLIYRNQELLVVCNDYLIGPAIQVVSLTGRIKQTIDTDRAGQRILEDPYYMTVTPSGKLIYVSDKDRIVCMDRHGNVTSVYKESSLRNARGIDIDSEGNLYVCGYMSNTLHQITMHGIDFRCLLSKEQVWDPWSVTFNESNGTILVTSDSSDLIKVYTLE